MNLYNQHPLTKEHIEIKEHTVLIEGDITLYQALKLAGYQKPEQQIHAYLNGELVLYPEWKNTLVKHSDHLDLKQFVAGDDSDPIQIIATIAILALSLFIGGPAGVAFFGSTTGAQFAAAGVLIGGNLLISAIFAPTIPEIPDGDISPNYGISGTQNRARPGAVLPLLVGHRKFAPDFGSGPYTTQSSDDVFFEAIYNFGYGFLRIQDIKIGQTPIGSYQEIENEITVDGVDVITLVAGDVVQTAGGALEPRAAVLRTSATNTTRLEIDLEGLLFRTNKKGKIRDAAVTFRVEYRPVGGGPFLDFFEDDGPFVPLFPESDFSGGYSPGRFGPTGTFTFSNYQIKNSDTSPVRETFSREVAQGQYEVRIERITLDFDDPRPDGAPRIRDPVVASFTWTSFKSFQPDDATYEKQKRLAIKVRATGQLNGQLDTINADVFAKHPVFNSGLGQWELDQVDWQETSNPAAIFVYLAIGIKDDSGKQIFGLGFQGSQLDLEGLAEWHEWCIDNSLECNFIFDTSISNFDALQLVARTGRASLSNQKGTLGVVFDQEARPIIQRFGMSNTAMDSFGINYLSKNLADEITIEFINEDADFTLDEITVPVTGVVSPIRPTRFRLDGITNVDQIKREANLMAARQFYHTRRVSFQTDVEGLICERGDVIAISHDLTQWGSSGRLVDYVNGTKVLTLDREVDFDIGVDFFIAIRQPNQVFQTVAVVNPGDVTTDVITLVDALNVDPTTDPDNAVYDFLWFFDFKATPAEKFKVISVDPTDQNRIRITAINEVAAYYDSASNPVSHTPPVFNRFDEPAVEDFTISETWQGETEPLEMNMRWNLVNATGARIRVRLGQNRAWTDLGEIFGTSITFDLVNFDDGEIFYVEASPVSLVQLANNNTAANVFTHVIDGQPELGDRITAPIVSGLQLFEGGNTNIFTGKDAKFTWNKTRALPNNTFVDPVVDPTELDSFFKDYLVTITETDGTIRRTELVKEELYIYTIEKNLEDSGEGNDALREFLIEVIMRTTVGKQSDAPAVLGVSNPPPAVPSNITASGSFNTVTVSADQPVDIDFAGTVVWLRETDTDFTPEPADKIYEGPELNVTANVLPLDVASDFRIKIAHFDTFGTDQLNISAIVTLDISGSRSGIPQGTTLPDVGDFNVGDYFVLLDDPSPGDVQLLRLETGAPNFWTEGVNTQDIAANAIVAAKILAGSIETDKLDANAVTAAKANFEDFYANDAFINALATEQLDLGPIIFVDASNAQIDASLTLTGTGEIKAGKDTFIDDTAGYIIEFNGGTPRFNIGDANNFMKWDGTGLEIRGDLNADDIIAGSISAEFITIDGLTLENVGGVLEISDDGVVTAKIEDNAVTNIENDEVGSTSPTNFTGQTDGSVVWDTIATAAITIAANASQQIITISVEATVSGGVDSGSQFISARIRRGSTTLWEGLSDAGVASTKEFADIKASYTILDTGVSGAQSYTLELAGSTTGGAGPPSSNFTFRTSIINVMEVKK